MEQLELFPTVVLGQYPEQRLGTLGTDSVEEFKDSMVNEAVDVAMSLSRSDLDGKGVAEMLKARHMLVIAMDTVGARRKEICEVTGYSERTVQTVMRDPRAKAVQDAMLKKLVTLQGARLHDRIKNHTDEAFDAVVSTMRTTKLDQVRLNAAFDVMDRGGFKPKEVVIQATANIDRVAGEAMAQALRESFEDEPELRFVEDSSTALNTTKTSREQDMDLFTTELGVE
jgi:hypothetical protein